MNFSKNLRTEIRIGDLVEYKDPLPDFKDAFGIVLNIGEITSNVYERGYIEATVRWNKEMWIGKGRHLISGAESLETFEDVCRLQKIS